MYTLIELPYAMVALEPVISAQTLSFHHGKHLQAYVDNLNKLLPGSEYVGMALEEIVQKAPAGAVFNNAGQILNHELYFTQFKPASEAVQKSLPVRLCRILRERSQHKLRSSGIVWRLSRLSLKQKA